jgi:hypothetical protein
MFRRDVPFHVKLQKNRSHFKTQSQQLDMDSKHRKRGHCQMKRMILPATKGEHLWCFNKLMLLFWVVIGITMTSIMESLYFCMTKPLLYFKLTSVSLIIPFSLGLKKTSSWIRMMNLIPLTF